MKLLNYLEAVHSSVHVVRMSGTAGYHSGTLDIFAVLEGSLFLADSALSLSVQDVFAVIPGHTVRMKCTDECILLHLPLDMEMLLDHTGILRILGHSCLAADNNVALFHEMIGYKKQRYAAGNTALFPPLSALKFLSEKEKEFICGSIPDSGLLTSNQRQKLESLLLYVHENLLSSLSLAETAKVFSITPQYLATFWKKYMNVTFQHYIKECRLALGQAYIRFTSCSAETVSRKCGLSVQQLPAPKECRSFSAGQTSVNYNILSDEAAQALIEKFYGTPDAGLMTDAKDCREINVSACSGVPFADFWKKLINLGYSTDFSSNLLFHQIEKLQSDIGFEYGRICRIFDLIERSALGDRTVYDYEQIFHLIDIMVLNHLHPFFEISNKLYRLHLSHIEMIPLNIFPSSEEYYEDLLRLLPEFLKTCRNRYGNEEVRTWRFEISYINYDYRDFSHDFSLDKYISYFKRIKELLNTYIPGCRVGGPGFNSWETGDRIIEVLECFEKQKVLPDFLTAYLYPVILEGGKGVLSEDTNEFIRRLSEFERTVKKRYPDLEIWITEFNSNLSSRNMINDSEFQASFLTDTVIRSARTGIKALGYYMLSDHSFRHTDTTSLLFGGLGLISDRDIPKPSYYAYRLFAGLGKNLLFCCDNLLLTSDSDSRFQCLICSRKKLSPEFLRKNVDIRDYETQSELYQHADSYQFHIELEHAAPGRYMISEYSVSETSGNILHEWKALNYLTPSSYDTVRLLIQRTKPHPHISVIEVGEDRRLSFSIHLSNQESRLYQIEKQLFI